MNRQRYRNTAFLMEVLVNILVFSISCSILVSAFVQAAHMVRQTRDEGLAASQIYALMETIKIRGTDGLEQGEEQDDGTFLFLYGNEWEPLPAADDATYAIVLEITEQPRATGDTLYITGVARWHVTGREITRISTIGYSPWKRGDVA